MKVSSVIVAAVLSWSSLALGAEKLRGTPSVYRGNVHVVRTARTSTRKLDGEIPVPPPLSDSERQAAGTIDSDERNLYEAHPDIVKPETGDSPIVGTVFHDANKNGVQDSEEEGIEGVMVSNGLEVVLTGSDGRYELPTPTEEEEKAGFTVFITKPAGYQSPVNEDMVPQFHYHHKPEGSPMSLHGRPFRFGGMAPTGALPMEINFPLVETENLQQYKVVVSGDPQTYSNNEIGYLRDSIIKDTATMDDLQAIMFNGDIMGDELTLYKRLREVVGLAGVPQYYSAGNHDMDFDSPENIHSFDTFKREFGPDYYTFDIGQVHFVVMNDVFYPCTPEMNEDGLHDWCDTPGRYDYNGYITSRQMQWLKNDLANVPEDKLIFLLFHIPIYAFIDQNSAKHAVDNVRELYEALGCTPTPSDAAAEVSRQSTLPTNIFLPENCSRKIISMHAHSHTNDNMLPGENFEGFNTALGERAAGPVPFHQVILGAACGNWWSGDFDQAVVPESFQRLGAPKGYWIFEFDGSEYEETFKASGKPIEQQMHVDILTPEFQDWYETISNWTRSGPSDDEIPPLSINDLPDTKIVLLGSESHLSVNVWAGTRNHVVEAYFDVDDGSTPIVLTRTQPGNGEATLESLDVYALKRQLSVARYAYSSTTENERTNGFELFRGDPRKGTAKALGDWQWADQSIHVWQGPIPTEDLGVGAHTVKVVATDQYGRTWEETMAFEIREERPNPLFQTEFFPVTP